MIIVIVICVARRKSRVIGKLEFYRTKVNTEQKCHKCETKEEEEIELHQTELDEYDDHIYEEM